MMNGDIISSGTACAMVVQQVRHSAHFGDRCDRPVVGLTKRTVAILRKALEQQSDQRPLRIILSSCSGPKPIIVVACLQRNFGHSSSTRIQVLSNL
jgi:hypothetical protein